MVALGSLPSYKKAMFTVPSRHEMFTGPTDWKLPNPAYKSIIYKGQYKLITNIKL